ncbi:MAG: glycerate kinase, partial [Clostridia bacterium]|nr:glycerate kinase [Clostridia bacterium]
MRIVIAVDSFKGSLTTLQAGNAVAEGARRALKNAEMTVLPLADGGEGTVDALTSNGGGARCSVTVSDPLGRPVQAVYGVTERGVAVMEMAASSGLTLLTGEERNPLVTSTYGFGELIRHAIEQGCREFLIGIGGSATNDGGVGMLQALGFDFLDGEGRSIPPGARGLKSISKIDTAHAISALSECHFRIACDVKNPLCGPRGCSAVYGPQKGATPEDVERMDAWLTSYAALTAEVLGRDHANLPGAGAAGGLGFAFSAYLGGELRPGIELVMEQIGLEECIRHADLVITGEGRLDGQSCMGKAPVGVASLAKRYGVPVLALCGCVGEGAQACNDHGVDAFF